MKKLVLIVCVLIVNNINAKTIPDLECTTEDGSKYTYIEKWSELTRTSADGTEVEDFDGLISQKKIADSKIATYKVRYAEEKEPFLTVEFFGNSRTGKGIIFNEKVTCLRISPKTTAVAEYEFYCKHKSSDNWPMLQAPKLQVKINNQGDIINGLHGERFGMGRTYNDETSLVIHLKDFEYGPYYFDNEHYLYSFSKTALKNLKLYETTKMNAVSNIYMGHFDEDLICQRVK